jgi:Holliday junction resolvase RusA-like endonuclease
MFKIKIPMRLPGLNEFIAACNSSRYKGNNLKQSTQADIRYFLKRLPKIEKPIRLHFIWISTKNDRRDPDNIASACKFVLDAMQQEKKLKNDNRAYIKGIYHDFDIGSEYAVIVEIEELKSFKMEE